MLEIRNLGKTYQMGSVTVPALKNVSFTIRKGEFVAIMGPSGSGKSTLMNILGCLDVPTSGQYLLDGIDITRLSDFELAGIRNEKIGFVFQSFNLLPRLSALANTILPLIYTGKTADRKVEALEVLRKVGLESRASHRPRELSGGEQQRVAIARALINRPKIILADEPTGNLDSRSSQEIMSILAGLHRQGITVIIVTHEDSIAEHADRTIRLHDGAIIEDSRRKPSPPDPEPAPAVAPRPSRWFSAAELNESVSMAASSIFANKLRSFLTMLGIIVGVSAVIAMLALGQGASSQITEHISQLGANLIMIFPAPPGMRGHFHGAMQITTLTYDDALAMAEECPSVARVDASFSKAAQLVFGNRDTYTRVSGVTTNFPAVRNFPVERGSFFSSDENRTMRRVAVLGKTVVNNLFAGEDPLGQYIKINRSNFQVIGVMSEKGSSGWRDEDDEVFIPLKTAQKRLFGVDYLSNINVESKSRESMDRATEEITAFLRDRHRVLEGEEDFRIRSQAEILATVQETSRTFTLLLAGIAVVSLIVGGIGIMNIMLVSVTERTREIGIRKAIGAKRRDILSQFLIESVILSLSGGVIGVALGILVSRLASSFTEWPTIITPFSVVLSFSFAFAVGLFFGFYPARKAASLNPIEALRYE